MKNQFPGLSLVGREKNGRFPSKITKYYQRVGAKSMHPTSLKSERKVNSIKIIKVSIIIAHIPWKVSVTAVCSVAYEFCKSKKARGRVNKGSAVYCIVFIIPPVNLSPLCKRSCRNK